MAGQKSGKAPGKTPYAPGGAEVWSDSDHDYFTDPYFHREASLEQTNQQWKDQDRLSKEPAPNYAKGGQVGKIGGFGMKRSKPDFARGGSVSNHKSWSK